MTDEELLTYAEEVGKIADELRADERAIWWNFGTTAASLIAYLVILIAFDWHPLMLVAIGVLFLSQAHFHRMAGVLQKRHEERMRQFEELQKMRGKT